MCVFFPSGVFHALVIFPEKEVMEDQGLLFWLPRGGFGEEKSWCNSIRNESEFEEIHRFKMVSENFTIGLYAFIVW